MKHKYGISSISADFVKTMREMPEGSIAYLKKKSENPRYKHIIVPVKIKGYGMTYQQLHVYITVFDPSKECPYDTMVNTSELVSLGEVDKINDWDW